MSASGRETEAKFYVHDLKRIQSHLEGLGARLVQERVLERNIRFDLPGGPLRARGRVLRLRQDTESRLTYKGGSKKEEGVLSREEIEFVVGDFEKAKQFLEALGYREFFYYEKYRTTYAVQHSDDLLYVMLDELPYGNFVEIEGNTVDAIHTVVDGLHLKWDCAIALSYHALFERVRHALDASIQDLSFAAFDGRRVGEVALGVNAADE